MNPFDVVISAAAAIAIVSGFRAGLLRSTATMLGYLAATPVAVSAASWITPALAGQTQPPFLQNSIVFFAVLLLAGLCFSRLFRSCIDEAIGPVRSLPDRVLGGLLGLVRTALVALTLVVVIDRIAPAGHDPAFLNGSAIRPMLSLAGQRGLKSLPPEVADYIDRLKKSQGI